MSTVADPIDQGTAEAQQSGLVEAAPLPDPEMVERTPENDAIYRSIRAEISSELTLITARVNWLIASQAFLFMPLTIGSRSSSLADSALYPLIPIMGLLLCVLILVSIFAAVWRSQQWRRKGRRGAYRGDTGTESFSIILPHTPMIPLLGFIGCFGIPLVLILTWVVILIAPPVGG